MNGWALVVVNLSFIVVGYALLSPFLIGTRRVALPTYAGLALVVGAGATGVLVIVGVVVGVHPTPAAFAVAATLLVGAGLSAARIHNRPQPLRQSEQSVSVVRALPEALLGFGLFGLAALVVYGALQSSPQLDDTWFEWLPRGLMLQQHGLDPSIFAPDSHVYPWADFGYPLWWSLTIALVVRVSGTVNMHLVSGELALLTVAFVLAFGRLLWGRVRPLVLWAGLLLYLGTPAVIVQTQSGGADLVVAGYLVLFAVASGIWLAEGEPLALWLVFLASAIAPEVKDDAFWQLVVLTCVFTLLAVRSARPRIRLFLGCVVAGAATYLPWFLWLHIHRVHSRVNYADAFNPSFLAGRVDRISPAARTLQHDALDPRMWLWTVPIAIVLSLATALIARRMIWLTPIALLLVGWAFWTYAYWAGSFDLDAWLKTSADWLIFPFLLIAAVANIVLAERLVRALARFPFSRGAG